MKINLLSKFSVNKFHDFVKTLLLTIILILTSILSYSQVYVGNIDINQDKKIKIIEVLVADRISGKSINVFVDFGQKSNFRAGALNNKSRDQRITDPETKEGMLFISTSTLLNFMEINGWEHYSSLILNDKGALFYYYFKRK